MKSVLAKYVLLTLAAALLVAVGAFFGNVKITNRMPASSPSAPPVMVLPLLSVAKPLTKPYANPDFRQFKWNDSQDQAKARSNIDLNFCTARNGSPSQEQMFAKTEINNYPATLYLLFHKNQLYQGIYRIEIDHSLPPDEYVNAFRSLEELLSKKYGKANDNNSLWVKDSTMEYYYSQKPGQVPAAILTGKAEYLNSWNYPSGKISLHLYSRKGQNDARSMLLELSYETNQTAILDEIRRETEKLQLKEL